MGFPLRPLLTMIVLAIAITLLLSFIFGSFGIFGGVAFLAIVFSIHNYREARSGS